MTPLAEIEDGALGPHAARGELVRMRDAHDLLDAGRGAERKKLFAAGAAVAHDSDHGSLLAADQMRLVPAFLDAVDDVLDLLCRLLRLTC